MRHIGEKLLAHLVNLVFPLNILEKFIVGCLQFGDRSFQHLRHLIDIVAQNGDLRPVIPRVLRIKVQMLHLLRDPGQLHDRSGNAVGQSDHQQDTHKDRNTAHISHEAVRYGHALLNALQSAAQDKEIAVIQHPPHLYILGLHADIRDDLYHITVFFQQDILFVDSVKNIVQQMFDRKFLIDHSRLDHLGIAVQDQDINVIFVTYFLQFDVIQRRGDVTRAGGLIDADVCLDQRVFLIVDIIMFQKSSVCQQAEQNRTCDQHDKNTCELSLHGIFHKSSFPF